MNEIENKILGIWKTFPANATGKKGFCTYPLWHSLQIREVWLGFWCETNFKLLSLSFSLKNEPHCEAFAITDWIQPLKIAAPYSEGEGWLILTLQSPGKESLFLGFCADVLLSIIDQKDEKKRLLVLREALQKWQPIFDQPLALNPSFS